MSNPLGITAVELNSAKGAEIDHHVQRINGAAGKWALTKWGNNNERRKRVATYLGLDLTLTAPPPPPPEVGPDAIDEKVRKEQWAWARKLAQEWANAEAAGSAFKLWPGDAATSLMLDNDKTKLVRSLPDTPPALFDDRDRVRILTSAAEQGDLASLRELNRTPRLVQLGAKVWPSAVAKSASPPAPSVASPPSSPLGALRSRRSSSRPSVLDACDRDIEVLQRTEGLLAVLKQLQSGLVQRLRKKYGPSSGRSADLIWKKLGQQISRRERLMRDFENEFGSDKERFLAFFTYEGKVRKRNKVKTRSMRLMVTKDIPFRDKRLNAEGLLEQGRERFLF